MNITPTRWGNLPAYRLQHPSGASALITLYGAHLVEWISADGQSRLFCSELSARDGSKAIRGGVPLIFPQFSAQGSGMRHGFARVSQWRLAEPAVMSQDSPGSHDSTDSRNSSEKQNTQDAPCRIEFELSNADLDAGIAAAWPHAFILRWRITLAAQGIELHFSVENRSTTPFYFASALHSYWAVDSLAASHIRGLQHLQYIDQTSDQTSDQTRDQTSDQTSAPAPMHQEQDETLGFADKVDRIYQQAITPLQLRSGKRLLRLEQAGFCDTVVWNPGEQDAKALSDMGDEEFQRFVCIEAARITPITLSAGEKWEGWQRIKALS